MIECLWDCFASLAMTPAYFFKALRFQTGILPANSLFPCDRSLPGADLRLLLVLFAEPAAGHALRFRVEGHAVPPHHVEVPEEGVLVAREGEVGNRHGDPHVHPDHPGMGPAHELPGVIAVLREDARAVGEAAAGSDRGPLLEIRHPLAPGH